MSILKRFAFYFGGFAIGLILLYFFVGGSGASCEFDYGPNSRTLKNIRIKERIFTNKGFRRIKEIPIRYRYHLVCIKKWNCSVF